MIWKRPDSQSWMNDSEMFDRMAGQLFQYLQKSIIDEELVDFRMMYENLDTWKSFAENCGVQEFGRWNIMRRIIWCAQQAAEGTLRSESKRHLYCGNMNTPESIKHNEAWLEHCISLLQSEITPVRSVNIPVAISNPFSETGYILSLILEQLEPGNGAIFHHPMDVLMTCPSRDFIESMGIAWTAALSLTEQDSMDIGCNGRWRLVDRHSRPVPEISGTSASAAAAIGWSFLLHQKKLNDSTIVLAQLDSDGVLSDVTGIREKTRAIAADGRFDTIVVASQANRSDVQNTLRESNSVESRVIALQPHSRTLRHLVGLYSLDTIYYNFHSNGDLEDWKQFGQKGIWQIESGELSGNFSGFPSSDYIVGNENWEDYTIECQVKFVDIFQPFPGGQAWAGIMIRYNDTRNTYVFAIDLPKQTAVIDMEIEGNPRVQRVNFPAVKNKYYRLRVLSNGNNFQFFIDDNLVHNFTDPDDTFPSGKAGFMVMKAHAHFRGLVIQGKGLGVSQKGSGKSNRELL